MKQGNQTQVMNEVDTGGSGSSCGGGGGGVGRGRVTRKGGGIRETGRRRDSNEDGLPFFLSECLPRHLQSLQEKVQAQKIKYSRFSPVLQFIHLDYRTSFRDLQISAEEMSSSF